MATFIKKGSQQCQSCSNFQKKLKIIQADYDFQIKKIQQDKSTQKALYELNTNRQIKKITQKWQKEKQQRLKENQNWMKKYDELIQRNKIEMEKYQNLKNKEIQEFKKLKEEQLQKFKQQKVNALEITIKQLQNEKQSTQKNLIQKHSIEIKNLISVHQQKMITLGKKHDEKLKERCEKYENTIIGLQSEKTVEQNLHKKTKQQAKQQQARLLQDIYCLKKTIIQHEEKISSLKENIKQKCQTIQLLQTKIIQKECLYNENYKKLSQEYQEKYMTHRKQIQKKFEEVIKKQLDKCNKYEQALEKIQEHRDIQNKMYKANLEDIKSCVQDRPSRLQDIQQIIKLREKLNKKQKQLQNIHEELKWHKLQLENKQQTYNRIFGPEGRNNENIYARKKDLKLKRAGKSVTVVRQILQNMNTNSNYLAPLVGAMQKKFMPPKQNKIL